MSDLNDTDAELIDWLRTAPSNEWNGRMLYKIADQLEKRSRENVALMRAQREMATRIERYSAQVTDQAERIGDAITALGGVILRGRS